ncbi:hydroxyisourate hydrolase [Streptomyces sp. NPDC088400]|uniref:hydroxyisourate hydrolase n=1 Tax=Streptomyces sp. NPDC088400 TaxID=3365861 RepID=UPI0038309FC8
MSTDTDPDTDPEPGTGITASVSTHILDTSTGRPAEGVAVSLAARSGLRAPWVALGGSRTDADGRCKDLPALPEGTTHVRLDFETEAYFVTFTEPAASATSAEQEAEARQDAPRARDSGRQDAPRSGDSGAPFFPEVAITFTVTPGEHFHVPLLLNPFGYSVYRGS